MSEFKNDKTSLENAKFDFSNDHHDLYEHLHRIEDEHKQMLDMLQYLNRRGGLGLDIHNKIEQLIKQATDI